MIKLLREWDDDDYDYDYGESYEREGESDTYTMNYYTYYKNSREMEVPLWETELESTAGGVNFDDDADPEMFAEKLKKKIEASVMAGEYPGLWVHRITIKVFSNIHQTDVDSWRGESWIDEYDSGYDSEELEMPEDWDDDNPDYEYLSDYVWDM